MSIKLPAIISSGMVIEKVARIWGYSCGEKIINIEFKGKNYSVVPSNEYWEVNIYSENYGGPYLMKINDIVLNNIYIGKVFCASGQSNMELPISRVRIKYNNQLKSVDNKKLRIFTVEKNYKFYNPEELYTGKWEYVSDKNIDNMFATSYFFGKKYQEYENIPIGIINTAAGGSKIQSWLKEDDIKKYSDDYDLLKKCQQKNYVNNTIKYEEVRRNNWHKEMDKKDIGISKIFTNKSYDYSKWGTRELTEEFNKDLDSFTGVIWFKKSFYLDKVREDCTLFLGTIKDSDIAYVNGIKVGETPYQYPPRIYKIPKEVLCVGENIITIRVVIYNNIGGFTKDKDYKIVMDNNKEINLNGIWFYHIGTTMDTLTPDTFFFGYPTGLYNAMLYPVLKYTLTGFLWYQGESNTNAPYNYDELLEVFLKELYNWQGKGLPFALVQLPNFDAKEDNYKWHILREKQKSILQYKNCGLVVTLGMGEDNDLHPLNKKDVGESLANCMYSIISYNVETFCNVYVNK